MSRGTQELAEILEPYVLVSETLSLVSLNLYEIYDGARKYVQLYEQLFSLPEGSTRRESLIDTLVDIKVLIEDIMFHSKELHEQVDSALDQIDPEHNEGAPP